MKGFEQEVGVTYVLSEKQSAAIKEIAAELGTDANEVFNFMVENELRRVECNVIALPSAVAEDWDRFRQELADRRDD